ncbi:hypothetical protein [Halalkalibacter hemicellulosilyticus]|uniref:Uncharacterized protein n=1 Tax=Halalkalibacter hemicellulosilyticusJCM 9152 TaxID=1236971 RepID=W4QBV5_9BACI|nr:hypothetical protein [Halalkalibacter hemicellulosilyticus]GAE29412.1 hypothetical protein JCM9152_769 [Halalkalibacter hemicellulosilyticusJCM 9152]
MIELTFVLYTMNMGIAVFVSGFYGSFMIQNTGKFEVHSTIAACIHVVLSVIAISSWFQLSLIVSWFEIIAGLVLGLFLFIIGQIALFIFLYEHKERWMKIYDSQFAEAGHSTNS